MKILFLVFFLLFLIWVIGIPILKKRPIVLTGKYILVILLFLCAAWWIFINFSYLFFIMLTTFIGVYFFRTPWIIFGMTNTNLMNALMQSADGVQAEYEKCDLGIQFKNGKNTIRYYKIFNIMIVLLHINTHSKKQLLLIKNFRKLIDNTVCNT